MVNASNQAMKPLVYIECEIHCGERKIPTRLVIFPGVKDFILSKSALVELGIVLFKPKPVYKTNSTTQTTVITAGKTEITLW